MKFKVGERYKYNGVNCLEKGSIIEITEITNFSHCEYETVKGKASSFLSSGFDIDSDFAKRLTPIKFCSEKIVITSDSETTTAKLYDGKSVVKTATAKCSPDDEFDFETGARIAFDRLTGNKTEPEEKPLLNTKFCVVKGDDVFRTGHIYEVVDGKILNGNNERFPIEDDNIIHSLNELYEYFAPLAKRVDKRGWCALGIKIVEVVDE